MRISVIAIGAAATALVAAAVSSTIPVAKGADKLKVGFIYLGPIGDFGWTYQHEVGRQGLVKDIGDKIETTYLENVSEGPDAERSIEQLARTGHKLIFTTSFGYMDPTIKVAKKYPEGRCSSTPPATSATKNVSTYSGRFYEGRYIQGQIAGQDVEVRRARLHRLVPDSRGGVRHQRDDARRPVGQPEHQGQDHLGEHLVRSGQGSRRRQGAARPGRRRHHAAHRQPGGDAGRGRSAAPTRSARTPT